MAESPEISKRFLASIRGSSGVDNTPMVVLIMVCILFCLIWTPVIFRCRCRRLVWFREDESEDHDQAEIIRASLDNLRRLATHPVWASRPRSMLLNSLEGLSPKDRQEYLNNVLVSRRIVKVSSEGSPRDASESEDMPTKGHTCSLKTTLFLTDVVDVESTTKIVTVEPCSICLNDYAEGEILCWSQNPKCQHCFHKECAINWLMDHEKCPLCRNNYLSLDGDDDHNDDDDDDELPVLTIPSVIQMMNDAGNDDPYTFVRGMHLVYLLSQLQSMDDHPSDSESHLQTSELPGSSHGNVFTHPSSIEHLEGDISIRIENHAEVEQQDNTQEDLDTTR